MTSKNILGQIYLLKLIDHERADALVGKLIGENLALYAEQAVQKKPQLIRKEDLFAPLADGSLIFESTKFWDNFGTILTQLRKAGDDITPADLLRVLPGKAPTMLAAAAISSRRLESLFSPVFWNGRQVEALEMWYALPSDHARSSIDITAARRAIAKAAGGMIREDRLRECGVSYDDIKKAARNGTLEGINEKLALYGEHLRKNDLFAPGSDGDTIFYFHETWKHFDSLVKALAKGGERFEPQDFLFKRLNNETVIQRAIKTGCLEKVFLPEIWAGRVREMDRLWDEAVPYAAKNTVDYPALRQTVLEYHCSRLFKITPKTKLADLFQALAGDEGGMTPLQLKSTWKNIAEVREALSGQGEMLTTDLLRAPTPDAKTSYFRLGVKNGALADILDIAAASKQPLSYADLMTPDHAGRTAFDDIVEQKKLDQLLRAELWVGRAQDMMALWQKIPPKHEQREALQGELSRLNVLSMRLKLGPQPRIMP